MRIKHAIGYALTGIIMLSLPVAAAAQGSSINTFSPYTIYGVGDMSIQGTTNLRAMGGVGVAYRDPGSINYLNPASYSAIPRKSFLFNFGMEGENFYLKTADKKSSFNTFNVRDIAIQFPLAKNIGFGISVTPFTNVGYRAEEVETDPSIVGNLGDVRYKHLGEGGIVQAKAGIGWEVFRHFSIGAEMIYYLGNIDRQFETMITPITGEGTYYATSASQYEDYSRIYGAFGVQYNAIYNPTRILTLGATYQMAGKLKPGISRMESDGTEFGGDVYKNMSLPDIISVGAYYQTSKINIGADYTYNGWGSSNRDYNITSNSNGGKHARMRNTNTYKAGFEYTPGRSDVRRYMRRISMRVGARYSDYYLRFDGHNINDKAVTFGLGFPIRFMGMSNIDFGMEFGQRGTTKYKLVKENYFKFSLGFALFGDDYWFVKHKYD